MWKWLNPWRELRQAREHIAALEAECDALDREARDAHRQAYWEASQRYEMETKVLREAHDALLRRLADLDAMTPRPLFISPRDMLATTSGALDLKE